MVQLRIIYTPDNREYSRPLFKIISGKTGAKALANLAEMYDIEISPELIDRDDVSAISEQLYVDEFLNLAFVQDVDTGKVYLDKAFDIA